MLTFQLKTGFSIKTWMLFAVVYLCLAIWFIHRYFVWDGTIVTGFLLAPYLSRVTSCSFSFRFLLPLVVALILAIMLPVNTMFFVALLLAVLLLVESSIGKVDSIIVFLLLLISPVFNNLTRIWEFPLRLWLTSQVAHALTIFGASATASGNIIQLAKTEFSVDPACAGLNMLVISLIICLFVIEFYRRETGKRAGPVLLTFLCCFTIALNVLCNFFRILLLVSFKIMAGTLMHDFIGIGCLLVYVIVPLLIFVKLFLMRFGRIVLTTNQKPDTKMRPFVLFYGLHFIVLLVICFIAFHITKADNLIGKASSINLPGYHKKTLDGGIIKFENHESLIYIKPTAFYAPEHDPMVCWTGSGYEIKNIKLDTISGVTVYSATLQKKNDKIYAAWWFESGKLKTINQLTWRWKSARNNMRFYLVNVNASSPQKLRIETLKMLGQNFFANYKIASGK